jgi:hypothetical protein
MTPDREGADSGLAIIEVHGGSCPLLYPIFGGAGPKHRSHSRGYVIEQFVAAFGPTTSAIRDAIVKVGRFEMITPAQSVRVDATLLN